jgi:DNA-binding XRE family transcriptional regulator
MKNNLKSFRVKFGMTQENMAEKLGMSTTTYSFKETEKSQFTLKEAKQIADMFNSTIDEVFFDK